MHNLYVTLKGNALLAQQQSETRTTNVAQLRCGFSLGFESHRLRIATALSGSRPCNENTPSERYIILSELLEATSFYIKRFIDLLWTAPEILRLEGGASSGESQPGDVYSFAIILQEVITRENPFGMNNLEPEG